MINKQIYARLLRFCHHNEKGMLITDEGYLATHKVRYGDRKVTLKALHFLMTHGHLPNGLLISKDDPTMVDCSQLTYKPYKRGKFE